MPKIYRNYIFENSVFLILVCRSDTVSFAHIDMSTNEMFIALILVLGRVAVRVQKKINLLKREGQGKALTFCIEDIQLLVIKCLSS